MNKETKNKITGSSKLKTMIFSVIVAVAIWLVAVYVEDPSITVTATDVSIKFLNEDALTAKGLIIKGKENLPKLSVKVSGKRSYLMEYMSDISVDIDMEQITSAGDYELYGTVNMPNSYLALDKPLTNKIKVQVAQLTGKNVKLYAKQNGTNKDYIIKSEPKLPTVSIYGAQDEIEKISYAMTDVQIGDIVSDCDSMSDIYYCDADGARLNDVSSVYTNIQEFIVHNKVYYKKTVPVKVVLDEALAEEYILDEAKTTVSPAEIEVGIKNGANPEFVTVTVTEEMSEAKELKAVSDNQDVYIPYNNSIVSVKAALIQNTGAVLEE